MIEFDEEDITDLMDIAELQEENDRLNYIIKEVREYIKEAKTSSQEVENDWAVDICNMILEILEGGKDT